MSSFTNSWDQNFPADSGLVSAGAANLRQLRVDVQQRMAAISGTDANKPNLAGDAQPTSWTGVLFFAIDTGKVYQWSGSAWNDVTSSIASGVGGGGGGAGGVTSYFEFSNPTISSGQTIQPLILQPGQIAVNNHIRVMIMVQSEGPPATVSYSFGGVTIASNILVQGGFVWANFEFFLNTPILFFGFGIYSDQHSGSADTISPMWIAQNIPDITANPTPIGISLVSGGPVGVPTITVEVFS